MVGTWLSATNIRRTEVQVRRPSITANPWFSNEALLIRRITTGPVKVFQGTFLIHVRGERVASRVDNSRARH